MGYIAIVEDERDIAELVSVNLQKAGFKTESFFDGRSFFRAIEKSHPDLVVLDLMLPDLDGYEIIKIVRRDERWSDIPIVVLTARVQEMEKILGLELGADDYVTKPFSPKELVARIKAVLRRGKREESKRVEIGNVLVMDSQTYTVEAKGKKVALTPTEFRILHLLIMKKGKVLTRSQILDYLWGDEKIVLDRTVDVHIRHLREKLGEAGALITNVRGIGYKIEDEPY